MWTGLDIRPTRIVPCGNCTVCCQGNLIYLHPECGDDASLYKTEPASDGRTMLAHKPNGDCIYLDRKEGCTIYDRRPTICRELDCRMWLYFTREQQKQMLSPRLLRAAKRCWRRSRRKPDEPENAQ
jgi:hypothetical protein